MKTYIIVISVLILAAYLFISFIHNMSGYKDAGMSSDVIVVLTGGTGRIETGASLLSKGRAPFLILSGVNRESDLKSIFFKTNIDIDSKRVILETSSKSTYENAVEVKAILKEKGFKDIVLVTSNYHTKRAFYIFRKVLPPDVKIQTHPVSTPNFDENRWWQHATSIGIVVMEFIKFYWYKVQLYFYTIPYINN
ncbi:MAG: YdcF family protein [Deltaproteobacteria bacterium]|nr:YdcF family protein [Deltaproteobacteria bacterium]